MRTYNCHILYERTGCCGDTDTKDIIVLANNVLQAIKKAGTYREAGEVRKTLEVMDATLESTIDKK